MKKYILLFIPMVICSFMIQAQVPNLPTKATLTESLLTNRIFSNATQEDITEIPHDLFDDYTIEVVGKINSAIGRGLDIEARDSKTNGFRLSLGSSELNFTSNLKSPIPIFVSQSGEDQTIRVAVSNKTAYVYKDGIFLFSGPLSVIEDIKDGEENGITSGLVDPANLIENWAGFDSDNSGKPSDYGWGFSGNDPFNTANSGSGVRYLDNLSGLTYNGDPFLGRSMYIRWDGSVGVYSYPVTLEANTTYDFSMLYTYISNYNAGNTGDRLNYLHGNSILVGIGPTVDLKDRIDSLVFSPDGTTQNMLKKDFTFTTEDAGTYYITFTGGWAVYNIAQLSLNKVTPPEPRFIFGKNYPNGAVDMEISSVTFEEGAFAPSSIITNPKQTVTLTDGTYYLPTIFNSDYSVSGKTDLHLNGDVVPMVNSSISLNSDDSWLFIDNVKPSKVIDDWLQFVSINGQPANKNSNARIAIYVNGTVIIPNGNANDAAALTMFTEDDFGGSSENYEIFTLHDDLGEFDNRFRSFKLKRGYMATIGSNSKGLGFSKVYIADVEDIEVPIMPKGLYDKTSFIRVFRWEYVSKKGWAGGGNPLEQVNATWFYDWSASGNSSVNTQYTPIRQNGGWPDWNEIYNKKNSNHLLGFNEPDHTDQANMTVDQALQQWPQLLQSGFRLGSPAPSSPNSWLQQFMAKADSLNYRVDFVAIHAYWNSRVSGGRADSWYTGLHNTYTGYGKRPIWITEWNNGANWTGESWPSDPVAAFAKQAQDLPLILQVFDSTSFVERYSIYNWVEDKRAMVLADTLTPAGKIYAANKSSLAYNSDPEVYKPADIYEHTWHIAAPIIRSSLSNDYKKVTINWLDINGDLGTKYVLERKGDDEAEFTQIAEFDFEQDYAEGTTVSFTDDILYDNAFYRIYAISYEGDMSLYSASLIVTRDAEALPPVLSGDAISATRIKLEWTDGTNARSFNLKRSSDPDGEYDIILENTTSREFVDADLSPNTTYYYTISSLNSRGESVNSDVLEIATPSLEVPSPVEEFFVASGDNKASLTWDVAFDAKYTILRSMSIDGEYETLMSNLEEGRYEDLNLENGVTYYYKIFAYNEIGDGAVSDAHSATPQAGQYLHISFDENSGFIAKDEWGGYHGTLENGVLWANGKNNTPGAVALNPSLNSFIQLPNGVVSQLNDFTISAVFKIPAGASKNNARIFDFGFNTSVFMVLMPYTSGGIRYKITYAGGNYDITVPETLPTDQWLSITVTQEGTTFNLYVNNDLLFTDENATVRPSDMGATTANFIGKSQFPADPYGNFILDDFKIYDYAVERPSDILPIQLISFTGHLNTNGSVSLNWATSSEDNVDYFILERSSDGVSFKNIAEVKSSSPSIGDKYSYIDDNPLSGVNYYRLSVIDRDGSRHIHQVVAIRVNSSGPNYLSVYPNPITGNSFNIKYSGYNDEVINVKIYSITGREIFNQVFPVSATRVYTINNFSLPGGVYVVSVNGSQTKIIKK